MILSTNRTPNLIGDFGDIIVLIFSKSLMSKMINMLALNNRFFSEKLVTQL